MVVDTPPLPAGARKLRIVASQWLSWDRIAWAPAATAIADHEPKVRAQLEASTADLRFRGFNRLYRTAPNAPHEFDYAQLSTESPWLPFPGRYTRYGDVKELLRDPDDRSVVLAAGDEMVVVFDGADLPAGRARVEPHPLPGEPRLGQGRRPQHVGGAPVRPLPFRGDGRPPFAAAGLADPRDRRFIARNGGRRW